MAGKRRKKQEEPATEQQGDAYEPPVAPASPPVADSTGVPSNDNARDPAAAEGGESPDGEKRGRVAEKLRSTIGRYFKRRKAELIDDFNARGVGIKFTYDDPEERPSEEVKTILKTDDGKRTGFKYKFGQKQWRKAIGRDADPKMAVAVRLDAERRFEQAADQMSHEERERERRAASESPG